MQDSRALFFSHWMREELLSSLRSWMRSKKTGFGGFPCAEGFLRAILYRRDAKPSLKAYDELVKLKKSILCDVLSESQQDPENTLLVLERILEERAKKHGLDASEKAWLKMNVKKEAHIIGSLDPIDLTLWHKEAVKIQKSIEMGLKSQTSGFTFKDQELWIQVVRVQKLIAKIQGHLEKDIKRLQEIDDFEKGAG